MKNRLKKSDYITAYNTNQRRTLINYLHKDSEYKSYVAQGLPFFTEEELTRIEKKYPDGMTWTDINKELTHKGVILKKPTFRKYIQNKWLPQAIKDIRSSDKGKEFRYPSEIISHINFVRYFFYAGQNEILEFIKILESLDSVELIERIQDELIELSAFSEDVKLAIGLYLFNGSPEILTAIKNHFKNYPDKKVEKLTMDHIKKIEESYKPVQDAIDSFVSFLEKTTIQENLENMLGRINKKRNWK